MKDTLKRLDALQAFEKLVTEESSLYTTLDFKTTSEEVAVVISKTLISIITGVQFLRVPPTQRQYLNFEDEESKTCAIILSALVKKNIDDNIKELLAKIEFHLTSAIKKYHSFTEAPLSQTQLIKFFTALCNPLLISKPEFPKLIFEKEISLTEFIPYVAIPVLRLELKGNAFLSLREEITLSSETDTQLGTLDALFDNTFSEEKPINFLNLAAQKVKATPEMTTILAKHTHAVFSKEIFNFYKTLCVEIKQSKTSSPWSLLPEIMTLNDSITKLKTAFDQMLERIQQPSLNQSEKAPVINSDLGIGKSLEAASLEQYLKIYQSTILSFQQSDTYNNLKTVAVCGDAFQVSEQEVLLINFLRRVFPVSAYQKAMESSRTPILPGVGTIGGNISLDKALQLVTGQTASVSTQSSSPSFSRSPSTSKAPPPRPSRSQPSKPSFPRPEPTETKNTTDHNVDGDKSTFDYVAQDMADQTTASASTRSSSSILTSSSTPLKAPPPIPAFRTQRLSVISTQGTLSQSLSSTLATPITPTSRTQPRSEISTQLAQPTISVPSASLPSPSSAPATPITPLTDKVQDADDPEISASTTSSHSEAIPVTLRPSTSVVTRPPLSAGTSSIPSSTQPPASHSRSSSRSLGHARSKSVFVASSHHTPTNKSNSVPPTPLKHTSLGELVAATLKKPVDATGDSSDASVEFKKTKYVLYIGRSFIKQHIHIKKEIKDFIFYIPSSAIAYVVEDGNRKEIYMIKGITQIHPLPDVGESEDQPPQRFPLLEGTSLSARKEKQACEAIIENVINEKMLNKKETTSKISLTDPKTQNSIKTESREVTEEEQRQEAELAKKAEEAFTKQVADAIKHHEEAKSVEAVAEQITKALTSGKPSALLHRPSSISKTPSSLFTAAGCDFVCLPTTPTSPPFTLEILMSKNFTFRNTAAYIKYGDRIYYVNNLKDSSTPQECKIKTGKTLTSFESDLKTTLSGIFPSTPIPLIPAVQGIITMYTSHNHSRGQKQSPVVVTLNTTSTTVTTTTF